MLDMNNLSILSGFDNTGFTIVSFIIAVVISAISPLLLVYIKRKKQKEKEKNEYERFINRNSLTKEQNLTKTIRETDIFLHLIKLSQQKISDDQKQIDIQKQKIDIQKQILNQIINCANKALEDEVSFQASMEKLVNILRTTFKSEYCAIGKVVNDIVEDYACDYDKHENEQQQHNQKDNFDVTRKVNINNTEYMVCEALKNKKQQISIYKTEDIQQKRNDHYIYYEKILKSGKLSNSIIFPLRNNRLENFGYIQFINSDNSISIDSINQFQDGLLQLVQMVIKKEEDKLKLDENKKFIDDSNFIKKIIRQKDDVDNLLDNIMEYLSKEFNAAVISFRIPVLNGKEREPLFYLRRCYVNPKIEFAEQIKKHYYTNRLIKKQNELGGYDKLKCCNNGGIILENSMDTDYYSDFNIDLKEQTLMIPVLKDVGKYECIRIEKNPFCKWHENQYCVERFKKLYGLFKLRLFKDEKKQDAEIAQQEETFFIEEAKKRLSSLSGQITLILNSIVDKRENESLKIFRDNLKGQQFLKIRDFDKQFVEIIKESTHAKECSIYRYRKDDDYSEKIYLSATTSKRIRYKGVEYDVDEIVQQLNYSISDKTSIIVRVFKEKKSQYLFNLHNGVNIGDFIELIDGISTSIEDESVFIIPIIKKDEDATCLGVVVLLGKQKNEHTISTSYWEQDKGLIEFIVEMFTRISEADNERLTFLSQLRHELIHPIDELVRENNWLLDRYDIRKDPFDKKEVLEQLKNNIDNCFLFQHIIIDIDLIYSSSIKDIVYKIELQNEPWKILQDVIALFRITVPIIPAISDMPALYMDKYRIKQVFINILKNAIRYSYSGQPIEIYYKPIVENNVVKQHEIKFVNYGIGILEEDKERIFELYKRGKNAAERRVSGSGMGLYIVKEIMKAHGGDCIIRKLKDPTEISLIFPNEINQKQ